MLFRGPPLDILGLLLTVVHIVTLGCRGTLGVIFLVAALGKLRSGAAFLAFSESVREMTSFAPPWAAAVSAVTVLAEASIVALLTAGRTVLAGFALACAFCSCLPPGSCALSGPGRASRAVASVAPRYRLAVTICCATRSCSPSRPSG